MGATHLKALRTIPGATLVAVCSNNEAALAGDLSASQGNLGGQDERFDFSAVKKYRTIDDTLADPDIDAVDVCLPTFLHAPTAIAALRAGKHVLVEKPMALNAAECQAMIAESQQQGRILMAAQVLRFFPMYEALSGALADLGTLRAASFRRRCAAPGWMNWADDKAKSGGGVFDLLIHDVDYALSVFGLPTHVSATGFENLKGGLDLLTAQLFYDGFTATVTGGWHLPRSFPFAMEYTVAGDHGIVDYSSAGNPPTLYRATGEVEPLPLAGHDGYAEQLRYFVECCHTGQAPVRCTPQSSAAAVRVMRMLEEGRSAPGEKVALA